jgi:hypothetical protein
MITNHFEETRSRAHFPHNWPAAAQCTFITYLNQIPGAGESLQQQTAAVSVSVFEMWPHVLRRAIPPARNTSTVCSSQRTLIHTHTCGIKPVCTSRDYEYSMAVKCKINSASIILHCWLELCLNPLSRSHGGKKTRAKTVCISEFTNSERLIWARPLRNWALYLARGGERKNLLWKWC